MIKARVINVIEVRFGDEISYHTLEGVQIGGLQGGQRVEPVIEKKEIKPAGGVITSPKPEEIKREQQKEADKLMDVNERLKRIPR